MGMGTDYMGSAKEKNFVKCRKLFAVYSISATVSRIFDLTISKIERQNVLNNRMRYNMWDGVPHIQKDK